MSEALTEILEWVIHAQAAYVKDSENLIQTKQMRCPVQSKTHQKVSDLETFKGKNGKRL